MLKKKYLSFLLVALIGVTSGGATYSVMRENEEYRETINSLEGDLNTLTSDYESFRLYMENKENRLNETIEGLTTELNSKEEELNQLKGQIDEMRKEVSFNPSDVTVLSGATTYHMQKALKDTELYDLASTFVQAEQTYGVNAYVLASIVALESGWGQSERAKNGSNNLTGYAVYDRASRGETFSSKDECVLKTAELLSVHYLTPGGQWNNGVSVDGVNTKYSADAEWDSKVVSIANGFINKSNS